MSVYRRKYKLRAGAKVAQSKFYTIELRRADGSVERIPTKFTDKRAAQAREMEIRKQRERGEVGLADPFKAEKARPMTEIVDEFCGHLLGTLRRDDEYAYIAKQRLLKVAALAGWLVLGDVSISSFERARKALGAEKDKRTKKLRKPQTINQYLDITRELLKWCVGTKLAANPLAGVAKATAVPNPHYRRAATVEELTALMAKATPERRRFYTFVLYTPLRRDTLAQLRWSDLHLSDPNPWVEIRGETSKSRRREKSALRKFVAASLLATKGDAKAHDPLFVRMPTIDDLRADLRAANVAFDDGKGNRRLDLHAFRKTLIRLMKRSGVSLEEASRALHHKSLATTKKYYDEDEIDPPMSDAVERLPEIGGGL